jgi:hypothetical protein
MNTRQAERLPILGELHGEIMVFEPLTVKELGSRGATIETRFPLHLDSLHDLRLTLGATSVVVKGRVVHSHISEMDQDVVAYLSGLEFVALPDYAASAINAFLEETKAERSGIRESPEPGRAPAQ